MQGNNGTGDKIESVGYDAAVGGAYSDSSQHAED